MYVYLPCYIWFNPLGYLRPLSVTNSPNVCYLSFSLPFGMFCYLSPLFVTWFYHSSVYNVSPVCYLIPCYQQPMFTLLPFLLPQPHLYLLLQPLPPPSLNPYLTLSPFNSNVHDLVRRDSCYSFLLCGGVVDQEFLFALLCINKENAPSFPRNNSHQKRTQLTTKKVFFLDA